MAVEDKYVDSDLAAGNKVDAGIAGGRYRHLFATFETAAADDDGSVYRLFRVGADEVVEDLTVLTDGITSGTDFDVGVYKVGVGGAVVDADLFENTIDLSSGIALSGTRGNVMSAVAIENLSKTVGELLEIASSGSDTEDQYDICLTANTVGSGAATITVFGKARS